MSPLRRLSRLATIALAVSLGTCGEPTEPASHAAAVAMEVDSIALAVGETVFVVAKALDAQGRPTGEPVTWVTADTRIARVLSPGRMVADHPGRTMLRASSGSGVDSADVLVHLPRRTTVSPLLDTLVYVGDTVTLSAAATDSLGPVATSFAWVTRNPAVADVSQDGRVVARGDGATYVLAIEPGGQRDSSRIVVRRQVAWITVAPSAATRALLRQQPFAAIALDRDSFPITGVSFTWVSADTTIATIDSAGVATARALGIDTIRVRAGSASAVVLLEVAPLPALRFNRDTIDVGVDLLMSGNDVPRPAISVEPPDTGEHGTAVVTVSDSSLARVPPVVLFPEPFGSAQWDSLVGTRPGITQLTVSDPRYQAGRTVLQVSTPRLLRTTGFDTINVSDRTSIHTFPYDSLGHQFRLLHSIVVHFRSSDTTVLVVQDSVVVLPSLPIVDGSVTPRRPGQSWVYLTSPGFLPDSIAVTVTQPRLSFISFDRTHVTRASAAPGETDAILVNAPNNLTDAAYTISQSQPHLKISPDTGTFPPFSNPVVLNWTGLTPGVDTVVAAASGYLPDTIVVNVTSPTFYLSLPTPGRATGRHYIDTFVADTLGNPHFPASVSGTVALVTSSDPSVLLVATDTVLIGRTTGGGMLIVDYVGTGTAHLILRDTTGAFVPFVTPPVTVLPSNLRFLVVQTDSLVPTIDMGMGERLGNSFFDHAALLVTSYGGAPFSIHLATTNPRVARPGMSDVATDFQGLATIDFVGGDTTGSAWVVATAPGIIPDSFFVTVGRPTLVVVGSVDGLELRPARIEIQARDQAGHIRAVDAPLLVALSSTNDAVVAPDSAAVTIPAGDYHVFADIHLRSPGRAAIRVVDERSIFSHFDPGAVEVTVH